MEGEGRRALLKSVEGRLRQRPGDQRTQGMEVINLVGYGPGRARGSPVFSTENPVPWEMWTVGQPIGA